MAEVENGPNYGRVPRWGKAGSTDLALRAGYQKKDDPCSGGYKAVVIFGEPADAQKECGARRNAKMRNMVTRGDG